VVELGADLVGGWLVDVVEHVAGVLPDGAGRVRITGSEVAGAQMGEGAGFGVAAAQRLEQLEGSLVVRPRLPDEIAQLTAQVARTVEMEMGVVVAAQVGACQGETAVGAGLLGRIAQPVGGVQRGLLGGDPVVPTSALVEESGQGAGELAGVAVEPGVGGVGEGCDQDRLLGGEPRRRLVVCGERFG
jgi:hypothetical protein